MAAKRVGRKRGYKHGRKPPLRIVSDFGNTKSGGARFKKSNNMTRSKRAFNSK